MGEAAGPAAASQAAESAAPAARGTTAKMSVPSRAAEPAAAPAGFGTAGPSAPSQPADVAPPVDTRASAGEPPVSASVAAAAARASAAAPATPADALSHARATVDELVADQPAAWDLSGELPLELLRKLGAMGLLCAEVPATYGGIGAGSRDSGEFTAHVGALCSSLRSIMTSQGIAATAVQRFGDREQRKRYLAELTGGRLAAVGFSEPEAGSDLAAMRTRLEPDPDGDGFVLHGRKMWVTGTRYADYLLIVALHGEGAAAVMVPADAPGVRVTLVPDPMGCRAAGHCDIELDHVRLPASAVLGGGGQALPMLFTTALSYGRMSVAWGCVGILRACQRAATVHARVREQSGKPLGEHQLVARLLAELLVAERVASAVCEQASRAWEASSPDMAVSAVLAKYVASTQAATQAASAVQVLASAGANDGHVVARAYRDAKLMEIIEGSTEISQLILARHALTTTS